MEANEYPKTLTAVTNGSQFLNIRDEWDEAKNAALHNVGKIAEDRAFRVSMASPFPLARPIDFDVIGRNEATGARIVRNPFTGEVSEA